MAGLLIGLVLAGWAGATVFERRSQPSLPRHPAVRAIDNGSGIELVRLTDCGIIVPGDVHPNFMSWILDRDTRLVTLSMWQWDEGEGKVFDYTDPRCRTNPSLSRYIEHALRHAAPEGISGSDGGGGP